MIHCVQYLKEIKNEIFINPETSFKKYEIIYKYKQIIHIYRNKSVRHSQVYSHFKIIPMETD